MTPAAQILQDYIDWLAGPSDQQQAHLLPGALLWALSENLAGGGAEVIALAVFRATGPGDGYSTGDIIVLRQTPPGAPEYYNASTNAAIISIPDPTELGSVSTAANVIVTTLPVAFNAGAASPTTQRVILASDQPTLPVADASTLTTSTQTLSALGLSTNVSGVGKASVGVQLLWTGASTSQVVRLEGSMDGGTTWVSLSDSLPGDTFTTTEIADRTAAGLQPGIRYPSRSGRAEYTNYRLRWVSGTATNLLITWGLV